MRYLKTFFSDDDYDWGGAPVPMRWVVRVVVLAAIALLLYHLFAGSL